MSERGEWWGIEREREREYVCVGVCVGEKENCDNKINSRGKPPISYF